MEDNSILSKIWKVAYAEELYGTIKEVHGKELLHAGYKNLWFLICILKKQ